MQMKNKYNRTVTACFVGYIVQAVVNNFAPLLFLFFQKSYQIPLSQITLLVTFNFGIQLLVDLLSVGFVDRIGYRACMIAAHIFSAAGLVMLTFLPELLPVPFAGILMVMMVCAGASEQAVSQWASTFAEKGLGITKAAGDLAGPMAFAILMGLSRTFYGKYGDKIDLERFMACSSILCILSYLGISLVPVPQFSLIACAVCGLSVGIMWPGTFSRASAALPKGGTAMFALLALGGDVGCTGGPTLVGMVSGAAGDNLKTGVLAGVIFPLILLAGIAVSGKAGRKRYISWLKNKKPGYQL